MQSEAWSEAARLFALAIQKNPNGNEARDLKNMAIQESDAQVAFNAGLQAQENHNWKETIDHWSKIPVSSHYYDLEQQKSISGKLCDELLEKASFVQKTASSADLDDVIHEIFEIPLAPKRCRGNRSSILAELERRAAAASKDGGILEGVNEAIIRRRMRAKRQTASAKTRTKRDGVSRHQKKEKPESSLQDKIMNPYDDE
jgi:hypothetical protein